MSQAARVTSLERLQEFRGAYCAFGAAAKEALCSADMEIRRTFDELRQRLRQWQQEVHRRQELVAVAKIELNRRKISRVFGRQPDCTEQEENLRKAQERLRHAEARVEKCRRWEPVLQRGVLEYEGPARQFQVLLDGDFARAAALLERMVNALDAYVHLEPPAAPRRAAGVGSTAEPLPAGATAAPSAAPQEDAGPLTPGEGGRHEP